MIIYLAHPVSGDVAGNLARAQAWLNYLMLQEPTVAFETSWMSSVQVFLNRVGPGVDDKGTAFRERCMRDNLETLKHCDGLVLVGTNDLTAGMEIEAHAMILNGGWVADLRNLGPFPPPFFATVLENPITSPHRPKWSLANQPSAQLADLPDGSTSGYLCQGCGERIQDREMIRTWFDNVTVHEDCGRTWTLPVAPLGVVKSRLTP